MSLAGKTILVTRAAHQAAGLVKEIERSGGAAVLFPTIEILPPESWEKVDAALAGLPHYDGIFFTSTNGVDFFFQRLSELSIPHEHLAGKFICAVGEKTKQHVEEHGFDVRMMPEKFTAADILALLPTETIAGHKFLFPLGSLGKETLVTGIRSLGGEMHAVTVYRTVAPEHDHIEQAQQMLMNGTIDVVTFTSPSTVKNFLASFPEEIAKKLRTEIKIAAIGPVTAEAVRSQGLEPHIIAEDSTIESLVHSIHDYYASPGAI